MEERTTISLVMAMLLGSVPPLAAFAQINQSSTTDTNSQTTSVSEDDNFLTYQNATLGISIQYPSGWMKEEQEDGATFISPPSENNSEASSVIVNVQVSNLSLFSSLSPSGVTLQNYTNSTIEELTDANYSIVELSSTTLGIGNDDNTAHKVVSSKQQEDLIMQQMQIYTIRGSKLYSILYIAEASKNLIYLPTVEKMIDSFTITDHQEREGMLIGG